MEIPRTGRASRRKRTMRGARAATEHRGDSGADRFIDLLRTNEMDVSINASRRDNVSLTRENFGRCADNHRIFFLRSRVGVDRANTTLNTGIPRVANTNDTTVLDADVGLDDAKVGSRISALVMTRSSDSASRRAATGPCRRE